MTAKIIDIHRYYRSGGLDWNKIQANGIDAISISAGVGMNISPILGEQIMQCNDHGMPYFTYLIPSMKFSMTVQMLNYLDQPGVREARTCVDVEPPVSDNSIRCINATETLSCIKAIQVETKKDPFIYINPKNIQYLGSPVWLTDFDLWIAQWLYESWLFRRLYKYFDTFLARNPNHFPPYVRNTRYQTKTRLWQFTCKADAQTICASEHTLDPKYPHGLNEADLNISCEEREVFLARLGVNAPVPPPPPPPQGVWYDVCVAARNIRAHPNTLTGAVMLTLYFGDKVLVASTTPGFPGAWGVVSAVNQNGVITNISGYIYMNNLSKS